MNECKSRLENYELISDEIKYISNSVVRLKILSTLYEKPMTIKELNRYINVSYSSISSNMHYLELGGHIYLDSNKYHLSNTIKIQIKSIMELAQMVNLINKFFNILDNHIVDIIPNESVLELYLLGKANLIESNGVDAYRTYGYIEKVLNKARTVKCILPFNYENFNKALNRVLRKKRPVELIVHEDIYDIFEEDPRIKKLDTFPQDITLLLIVTDREMVLGLFKKDGTFDQNRLIFSKKRDSITWANHLFENFKNRNK